METLLTIPIAGGRQVNPTEIVQLQADGNYTHIVFRNDKKIVIATTLKQMESRCVVYPKLIRINKSLIINLDYVQRTSPSTITLHSGEEMSPSRRRKKSFFANIDR